MSDAGIVLIVVLCLPGKSLHTSRCCCTSTRNRNIGQRATACFKMTAVSSHKYFEVLVFTSDAGITVCCMFT